MSKWTNFVKGLHTNGTNPERAKWDAIAEYYLCTLGYAVGYGSLWRFPYLIYENGGGAFLIPYFIFVVIFCFPLLFMESALGQSLQTSVTGVFERVGKKYKGIGVAQILTIFFSGAYYNILLAYSVLFLWRSFSWPVPWKVEKIEDDNVVWNSAYFKDDVLRLTSGFHDLGNINYPILISNIIAFLIAYLCISRGLKATGKVAYITAPAPYFFLFIFLIRGFFLEGAWDGIAFLFRVDWSKLYTLSTWYRAANQVLLQYSLCTGVLITFASYKERHENLTRPAIIIPVTTALTGILCSFTVFIYMGHMATVAGVSISDLPLGGPDLVFVAYPAALTLMPGSTIWAILFFLMLFFLGIDTEFAFMEAIAAYFEDEKIQIFGKVPRIEVTRVIVVIGLFFAGFPLNFDGGFHFLSFYDDYTTIVPTMVSALLECIVFGWIYGTDKIDEMIVKATGERFPRYAVICIKYIIIPILAFLTLAAFVNLLFVQLFKYPWWGSILGLILMCMPLTCIVYYYSKYRYGGLEVKNEAEGKYALDRA